MAGAEQCMTTNGKATASGHRPAATERYASALLELFYPIHYRGNMALEDVMRGVLTRKQAAILWLIRSAGSQNGRSMRRKEVVSRLQDWFDVSSPAVTQTLRGMARPPLGLVRLVEDPDSAREKKVLLTPRGERFLSTMVERGREFLRKLAEQLPEDQLEFGIEFLHTSVAAFERVHADSSSSEKGPARKPRPHTRARTENGNVRAASLSDSPD
jgi:DNA-binding MarR family transcriptional regulator